MGRLNQVPPRVVVLALVSVAVYVSAFILSI